MFEQLLPVVKVGKRILKSLGEDDSMMMGELYNTIGNVYLEIGNPEKCTTKFLKVKRIREALFPPEDPVVANITNNLSLAETASGNYTTAIGLSKRVIAIRKSLDDTTYGTYKKHTLPINMSNLCRILWMNGNYDEGAEVGEQAIKLAKEAFGLKSRNTAQ